MVIKFDYKKRNFIEEYYVYRKFFIFYQEFIQDPYPESVIISSSDYEEYVMLIQRAFRDLSFSKKNNSNRIGSIELINEILEVFTKTNHPYLIEISITKKQKEIFESFAGSNALDNLSDKVHIQTR